MEQTVFALSNAEAARLYVSKAFITSVLNLVIHQELGVERKPYKPFTCAERVLCARHYHDPASDHRSAAAAILATRKEAGQ